MGSFRLISRGDELPVFAFTTVDSVSSWDVFALSRALRERGWQVPAYTFPENRQDLAVMRIVVRNGFSRDLADELLQSIRTAIAEMESVGADVSGGPSAFHH
jgi:glutamate decarboxylase